MTIQKNTLTMLLKQHLTVFNHSPSDVDEAAKEYLLSVDAYRTTDYGCKFDQFDIETFKAGAEWRQSNLWKSADGDELPELEREVVVFTQNFPNDAGIMKVGIAHRPNPKGWDGTSISTGKTEHFEPMLYDKGGWSLPDVKIWLDAPLPFKEDEV